MSWLARSIADGLRLQEDAADDGEGKDNTNRSDPEGAIQPQIPHHRFPPEEDRRRDRPFDEQDRFLSISEGDATDDDGQERGVRDDLSEFRDNVARRIWGVASFLAPPPPSPPPVTFTRESDSVRAESDDEQPESDDDPEEDNEELVEYEPRGFGQIEELTNFSPPEDYYTRILDEAIGITDEVLAFARNIAHHPETWLDFPIEEEEFDDFHVTDTQYKHVLAIEHLAPRLAALRIEFCPVHMSGAYFWMVYFVLLHSRLNKQDADLLSSPQIVRAREMWMQELHKQTKGESYWSGTTSFNCKENAYSPLDKFMMFSDQNEQNVSDQVCATESSSNQTTTEDEIEKPVVNEIEFIDKSVISEDPSPKLQDKEMVASSSFVIPVQDDNDDDGWVTDDSDLIGFSGPSVAVNEEDISFSDLENDLDYSTMPIKSKSASTEDNKTTKT
ncbi:uncharacterized protein LOC127246941 [Andrographis paniculata]|uniref:uncharacterized protein LOC127246941 n=1 Tax=Andrographis paniculata TaxID=175694 RepID=UPI0021E8CB5B|nr:uncharacterized protein LOC127246941 [Andrographis paniculata]